MAESVRAQRAAAAATPATVRIAACVLTFLLIIGFGIPPQALGLDPAWTEVLSWGFLNHAQWGRDLVFTYGPLGFLEPYTAYVDGIFAWYMAGQIILPAGFALTVGLLFRGRPLRLFGLFVLSFVCSVPVLGGDLSWAFTLLFGTVWLLRNGGNRPGIVWIAAAIAFGPLFAAIALTKFSLFPLWAAGVAVLAGTQILAGHRRRGLLLAAGYALAYLALWCACGQELRNLPLFLSTSLEIASGFSHAMGNRAPLPIEIAAVAMLFAFLIACASIAWTNREDRSAVAALALVAATALLFWLAFFTRGDHWRLFCPAFSLLPFALLADARLAIVRGLRRALVALVLFAACIGPQAGTVVDEAALRLGAALYNLTHLPQLAAQRRSEWREAGAAAVLPKINARIGDARVDMVTSEPGMLLLAGLNYAPRPLFQSYSAYTPRLARLNEAHFVGAEAPDYVLFQLAYIDGRVPTIEDALALVALLRGYRPLLSEQGFLLLQRDAQAHAEALVERETPQAARMHRLVTLPESAAPTVAFLHIELTTFGRIYTLLFREPNLYLTRRTRDGEAIRQRLVRATAASGFLISPIIESNDDWAKLYFSAPMRNVSSIVVDAETKWERLVFRRKFRVSFEALQPLRADPHTTTVPVAGVLPYPGFNLMPVGSADYPFAREDGEDTLFLHAPASMTFQPAPARYRLEATFGIQRRALADAGCVAARPDGIGVSIVLQHDADQRVLAHADIDPFHAAQDAGPQHISVDDFEVGAGDAVSYRVDVGPAGKNDHCDWSWVRDVTFERLDPGSAKAATAAPRDAAEAQHRH